MSPIAINRWLYYRLTSDSELNSIISGRVYQTVTPPGVIYPCLVFTANTLDDLRSAGPSWGIRGLYLIKIINPTSTATTAMQTVVNRIDAVLDGVSEVWENRWYASWRDSAIDFVEEQASQVWRHMGGLYWVLCVPM